MDIKSILPLFDREQRVDIEYHDMRKEVTPYVTRFLRPAPGMSFVLYSRLNEQNADEVIRQEIDYFSRSGMPFEWKVYEHDAPRDLVQRLQAHGFVPEERDAVMVLDLQEAPSSLVEPVAVDVREITDPDQLQDVIDVEGQVWGADFSWIRERLGHHLTVPDYLSVYVAYVDDRPVSTGWTYYHNCRQFASLWGGSTVADYRKRGLYTAVLARRAQEAMRRGFGYLTIDAGPMSRPIVARHGFQLLTYAYACEWRGANGDK